MAPASASLLPTSTSSIVAAAKRPAPVAAASDAEATLLPQDGAASKTNQSSQQQLECPRCKSGNTKFCYYNNYSTTQPRHFCRACRRYWTHGGTLRNVPVGGGCRRGSGGNKRRRADSPSTEPSPPTGSPAEDACRPDMLPATPPFFPFLSDGAFLPQFDLGLGGAATLAGFPWTPAAGSGTDGYDGLMAPWGGCDGTLAGGAWDDFTGIELTWPLPAGN